MMKIQTACISFCAIALIGVFTVILVAQIADAHFKVGGPLYQQLSRDNELVSDILPPPVFIIESYVEAVEALDEPSEFSRHSARLYHLHQLYKERRNYWMSQPINTNLKRLFHRHSDPHVQRFWRITENSFLPAATRGDRTAAHAALVRMRAAYRDHQNAVDQIVEIAVAERKATEKVANRQLRFWTTVTWSVGAIVGAIITSSVIWLIITVIRPLNCISTSIKQIARKQFGKPIEGSDRSDEIGEVASSIVLLRDSMIEAKHLRAELTKNQIAFLSAEQSSKEKSAFLANMSHELRTPLNAIIGFSEFMVQELFGPMNAKYKEYGALIHLSGKHLLDIISDILDMAKLEAGKFELEIENVRLDDVISDCAAMVLKKMKVRSAIIEISGDKGIALMADRRALRQILLNLLSNAAKFCSEGGKVAIHTARLGAEIIIEVTDDGEGILPEHLARLGRPFEQVTQDSKLARGGTGLGLALVYALAAKHEGKVQISSLVGEGTTVRVTIPNQASPVLAASGGQILTLPHPLFG